MYDSTFTPTLISLPILLLALTGCTQRFFALSEQEGDVVNVRFFWDNAINADPEGMTLLFYSSDKGVVYGDLISREEMEVR